MVVAVLFSVVASDPKTPQSGNVINKRVFRLFVCCFVFPDDVIVATLRQMKISENEQIMLPLSHRGYTVCMGGHSGEAEVRELYFPTLSVLFVHE